MRELCESEKIVFEMIKHSRKNKVYALSDFYHKIVETNDLGIDHNRIRMHVNNHIPAFAKKGLFAKVGYGQYQLMVSKKEFEITAKQNYGLMENSNPELEVVLDPKEIHATIDQSVKIAQLETKLNILAAAFISIGLKLQNSTDIHKILIETSQKIESVMS